MDYQSHHTESKILVLGDKFVGKTSLIYRIMVNDFNPEYESSLTIELKKRKIGIGKSVKTLKIWDVPDTSSSSEMNPLLLRNTKLALILGDLNNKSSYKSVLKWKKEVKKACKRSGIAEFPFVLVMNKSDVVRNLKRPPHKFQTDAFIKAYSEKNGFLSGLSVSCKSGSNFIKLLEVMSCFEGDSGSTAANSLMKGSLSLSKRTLEMGMKWKSLKNGKGKGNRKKCC